MNELEKVHLPELDFLKNLNSEQKQAVLHEDGPLLVLSGAGTGKTKVLTTRLANLIFTRNARANEIFAVTFTNKAAFEMKMRVQSLIKKPVEGMYIGTFHSIGVRLLRKHAELSALKSDFTILDTDDQLRLIKQVLSLLDLDSKKYIPKNYLYFIDSLKNHGYSYNEISSHEFESFSNGKLSQIYEMYQNRLNTFNSVDFGDLILRPVNILRENAEVLEFYRKKFKYVLVDEYQDTNTAQYMLLRLITNKENNICCVGDEDQSIYGWRGAQLKNILNFEKDFPNSKIIRLEQNYRSTGNILSAASEIISENKERIGKNLWTQGSNGKKVKILNVEDDETEALTISKEIENLVDKNFNANDVAVLTRATFQFKEIEDRFIKENIKYKVIGGLKFYERKEIRDSIAYLRLLVNQEDNLAFERIINVPKRGIGLALLSKINQYADANSISLYSSLKKLHEEGKFTKSTNVKVKHFLSIFELHKDNLNKLKHRDVAGSLLDDVGYTEMLQNDKTPESEGRLENIKKFVIDIESRSSIKEFLEEISLVIDNSSGSEKSSRVSLMTLHSAKGLEFKIVFLPGWEENIFPNQRSVEENGNQGLEEERRLAYVGITRAREILYISYANFRKQYNQSLYRTIPSRFLTELPKKTCEVLTVNNNYAHKKINYKDQRYENKKFNIGDKVFHNEFGRGSVLGINGEKLQVRFENQNNVVNIFSDFIKKYGQ